MIVTSREGCYCEARQAKAKAYPTFRKVLRSLHRKSRASERLSCRRTYRIFQVALLPYHEFTCRRNIGRRQPSSSGNHQGCFRCLRPRDHCCIASAAASAATGCPEEEGEEDAERGVAQLLFSLLFTNRSRTYLYAEIHRRVHSFPVSSHQFRN